MFKGASTDRKYEALMSPQGKIWNGFFAMLVFVALAFIEVAFEELIKEVLVVVLLIYYTSIVT